MASKILRVTGSAVKSLSKTPKAKNIITPRQWRSTAAAPAAQPTRLDVQETRVTELPNGMRVATENSGIPTATVGVWIDAGSRYETEQNNGVAHFVEHMAFKGTNKRTKTQLELEVENMGAHLNAYTSRDQTVYYAKCLSKDIPQAVDILSDILQNSKLGEPEINSERDVILREMEAIDTDLKEVVFDFLHAAAYPGKALGRTILGSTENVKTLQRKDMVEYIGSHYYAPRMVLAGSGGIDHDALVKLAEQHFGQVSSDHTGKIAEMEPAIYKGSEYRERQDDMPICHYALAVETPGHRNADNLTLMVANTVIGHYDRTHGGGQHLSSRLAAQVATETGIHAFQSFQTTYKDTGLWGVYAQIERMHIDQFVFYIQEQWKQLCVDITDFEVDRAKNQLKTNMMLSLDGSPAVCEEIGRHMLWYGRRIPWTEMEARIDAINAKEVREVCYKYIYDQCPVQVAVGPCEELSDYNETRGGMYWLRL